MSSFPEEAKYCQQCGSRLERQVVFGKPRPVCPSCGWIYFADPKVAVAVLVKEGEKILLGRRVNDPGRGQWTLPAGFVDANEDPRQAAERECLEETGLKVEIKELLDVIYGREHNRGAHILIVYRGEVCEGEIRPADDVDAVAFFSKENLPELAFSTTSLILSKYS
ncbi:MAG: NUDIX hydrolase [Chloroflexota bacterium]